MTNRTIGAAIAAVMLMSVSFAAADTFGEGADQFTLDFVPISSSTNPTSGYGIVNYDYRIGTYEITNAQWNKFTVACGTPTGTPWYGYDRAPFFTGPDVPTNCASWYEAAQFVNWLNTSTGHHAAYAFAGTQGQSDYTFATWSAAEAAGGTNLYRHKDAFYFLPTEDEWAKAAYWNGTRIQTYANASYADLVRDRPDPTKWNYIVSSLEHPWGVGSGAQEVNGTYDMMGNIEEWVESLLNDPAFGVDADRAVRGGSYWGYEVSSSYRNLGGDTYEAPDTGFRVAARVPEPASVALVSIGMLALFRRRRRR